MGKIMDLLTLFGLFSITSMLVCYAFENRSHWFILAFSAACFFSSIYAFLTQAWLFGIIEFIWAIIALHRWRASKRRT